MLRRIYVFRRALLVKAISQTCLVGSTVVCLPRGLECSGILDPGKLRAGSPWRNDAAEENDATRYSYCPNVFPMDLFSSSLAQKRWKFSITTSRVELREGNIQQSDICMASIQHRLPMTRVTVVWGLETWDEPSSQALALDCSAPPTCSAQRFSGIWWTWPREYITKVQHCLLQKWFYILLQATLIISVSSYEESLWLDAGRSNSEKSRGHLDKGSCQKKSGGTPPNDCCTMLYCV